MESCGWLALISKLRDNNNYLVATLGEFFHYQGRCWTLAAEEPASCSNWPPASYHRPFSDSIPYLRHGTEPTKPGKLGLPKICVIADLNESTKRGPYSPRHRIACS